MCKLEAGTKGQNLYRFVQKRVCPKDIAAPHQGAGLRVPREAGEKEKDRAEPSLLWAGDTAGNHRLAFSHEHTPGVCFDVGVFINLSWGGLQFWFGFGFAFGLWCRWF